MPALRAGLAAWQVERRQLKLEEALATDRRTVVDQRQQLTEDRYALVIARKEVDVRG